MSEERDYEDLIAVFLRTQSESTKSRCLLHLQTFFGTEKPSVRQIKEATQADIAEHGEWIAAVKSASTYSEYLGTLRRFFKVMCQLGYREDNPAANVDLRPLDTQRHLVSSASDLLPRTLSRRRRSPQD